MIEIAQTTPRIQVSVLGALRCDGQSAVNRKNGAKDWSQKRAVIGRTRGSQIVNQDIFWDYNPALPLVRLTMGGIKAL